MIYQMERVALTGQRKRLLLLFLQTGSPAGAKKRVHTIQLSVVPDKSVKENDYPQSGSN